MDRSNDHSDIDPQRLTCFQHDIGLPVLFKAFGQGREFRTGGKFGYGEITFLVEAVRVISVSVLRTAMTTSGISAFAASVTTPVTEARSACPYN